LEVRAKKSNVIITFNIPLQEKEQCVGQINIAEGENPISTCVTI
jgi:hypothetical protein